MLFQRVWAAGESCLWRTDVGWLESTSPGLQADISGTTEVFVLAAKLMVGDWDCFLPWIYNGSLNFRGLCWAYSQCVTVRFARCIAALWLLFLPPHSKNTSVIVPLCFPSSVTVLCTVWSSWILMSVCSGSHPSWSSWIATWKIIWDEQYDQIFCGLQHLLVGSHVLKRTKPISGKSCNYQQSFCYERTKVSPLLLFPPFFLCYFFKTFSFPFQGWIVLCAGCLQGMLCVSLQLWVANA